MPKTGLIYEETEVWIKGKSFTEKGLTTITLKEVLVMIGDRPAKIIESTDTLITIMAPARPDLKEETDLPLTVSNIVSRELIQAMNTVNFKYVEKINEE